MSATAARFDFLVAMRTRFTSRMPVVLCLGAGKSFFRPREEFFFGVGDGPIRIHDQFIDAFLEPSRAVVEVVFLIGYKPPPIIPADLLSSRAGRGVGISPGSQQVIDLGCRSLVGDVK